jgi:TolB-like protein
MRMNLQPNEIHRSRTFVPPGFVSKQSSPDKHRIAILPLRNISPDTEDEYFADGLTEEMISTMTKIGALKVIAKSSVMGYLRAEKKIDQIARELEVGTVIEGSVRKAGEKLRITIQLIDSESSDHLWSESYDREMKDIFAIQSEISKTVAEALRVKVLPVEKERLDGGIGVDPDAYTLYLQGKSCWNERSRTSLMKAIDYFEEAIARHPEFARAHSGLADCYIVLVNHGYLPSAEGYKKAKDALTQALDLDASLAEAHTSLGHVLSRGWDWKSAEEEFAKAIENNPNFAKAHHWYSIHLLSVGQVDAAIEQLNIAEELDPLSPILHSYAGGLYIYAHQFDNAMKELDRSLQLDPNFVPAHANRSDACLTKSMFEEAIAELDWVSKHVPKSARWNVERAFVYAISGLREEAEHLLKECETTLDLEQLEPQRLAVVYSKLGNTDHAMELIEKAFEVRSVTPFQVRQSPFYDTITSDPRFEKLFKKTVQSFEHPAKMKASVESRSISEVRGQMN